MWKDTDFREVFANFNPNPPEQVWNNISMSLRESGEPLRLAYFSQSQRLALLVAGMSSFLLCGIMFCFMEDNPRQVYPTSYVHNSETKSHSDEGFHVNSKKKPTIYVNTINQNTEKLVSVKPFSKRAPNLSGELKPFEKDLIALADLDRQIVKLGEEIAALKAEVVVHENWQGPTLAEISTQSASKFDANWKKYHDHLVIQSSSLTDGNETSTSTPKFIENFYITPYMGANYTLVFYQDKPANNFFSDKAIFSGQIGYNTGVQFGYQLSKRWSVESGLGIGQYIVGFKEDYGTYFRDGDMYIDQMDIPLLARYSFDFNKRKLPLSLAFKGGLIYSNVIFYQVNYTDKFTRIMSVNGNQEEHYKFDVDKSEYNSTQLGYALGFDFDAYFSKKISLNFSMLNAMVSQINNFPLFSTEKHRPIQFSSSLSIGTKIRF